MSHAHDRAWSLAFLGRYNRAAPTGVSNPKGQRNKVDHVSGPIRCTECYSPRPLPDCSPRTFREAWTPLPMPSNPLAERLSGARLDRGKRQRVDDVIHRGAAAEVVHRLAESPQHRANAHYLRAALDSFVCRVPGVEVWEDEDVGASGHCAAGPLAFPYRGDGGGVVLQGAVYGQIGLTFVHDLGRLGDLVDIDAHTGGAGAEADHRHPGFDAKGPRRRRALDGNVGQVFGVGLRVDGAIAVDDYLVGQAHEEHRRHQAATWLGAQDLQRRANGGRGGVDRARNQAVHFTLPEHHGADRDWVGEVIACHFFGPAAVPPQLSQRSDVALGDSLGLDHGDAVGQLKPEAAGQPGHLVWWPQQNAAGDTSLRARDRGLQDPWLSAFRQDHARAGGAGLLDQVVAEGGGAEPAGPGGAGQRL